MTQPTKQLNIPVQATLDIFPLLLSMTPWGILCGALAIESGLSVWQSQLMSLAMFAGAVQLSVLGLVGTGAGLLDYLNNTTMISSRHLLYSATFEREIRPLPLYKRLMFAFVLTDEMFAVSMAHQQKTGSFNYQYAVIAGLMNYLVWNISTFIGIVAAASVQGIDDLGLDFAIAATFIAMTVPHINRLTMLIAVVTSGVLAVLLDILQISNALIISGLVGMALGYFLTKRGTRWNK